MDAADVKTPLPTLKFVYLPVSPTGHASTIILKLELGLKPSEILIGMLFLPSSYDCYLNEESIDTRMLYLPMRRCIQTYDQALSHSFPVCAAKRPCSSDSSRDLPPLVPFPYCCSYEVACPIHYNRHTVHVLAACICISPFHWKPPIGLALQCSHNTQTWTWPSQPNPTLTSAR
jgi:hypothetical protein